jgi:hypothetical protein
MVENGWTQLSQGVSVIKNRPFSQFRVELVNRSGISAFKLVKVNASYSDHKQNRIA